MFIHFFCLCPLGLTIKLNFNISKVVYSFIPESTEWLHVLQSPSSLQCILVPRAHDPSGLRQESRALAGPDFLSMRRAFVSYSRPIRFDGWAKFGYFLCYFKMVAPRASRFLSQARRIVGSEDENAYSGQS